MTTYAARTYFTADGVNRVFAIAWPYLAAAHVHFYDHLGVEISQATFTFLTPTSLQLAVAPVAGTVEMRRQTPRDVVGHTIQTGTIIPNDINYDFTEALYRDQEILDQEIFDFVSASGVNATALALATQALAISQAAQSAIIQASGVPTTFISTAALLVAFGSLVVLTNGMAVTTGCRATPGDLGGGLFRYDSSDHATADNGGTIRVDGQGRRWFAQLQFAVPAAIFGAGTGVANNSTAINAALVGAASYNLPVSLQGLTLPCSTTLTFDISKTSIYGYGGTLDFTAMVSGIAINPFTSYTEVNSMGAQHSTHPVKDFRIVGRGATRSNASPLIAIKPIPVTLLSAPWITGMVYENISQSGFDCLFDITDGVVAPVFRNCSVIGGVLGTDWFFRNSGSNNSGENIQVDHCFIVNCAGFLLDSTGNPNLDCYGITCSIDGCRYIATGGNFASWGSTSFGGELVLVSPHLEMAWDGLAGWTSSSGSILMYAPTFVINSQPTTIPFRSDGTQVDRGIVIRDMNVYSSFSWPSNGTMCSGTGNFECTGAKGNGNSVIAHASFSSNRVPNSASIPAITGIWSGAPTTSGADVPAGATNAIILNNAVQTTTFVTKCLPGQVAAFTAQGKFINLGASDQMMYQLAYEDVANNILLQNNYARTIANASYQNENVVLSALAPPGTDHVRLTCQYQPSGGGATVKIALPFIEVS